jgi:hypothetical protein
MARVLIFDNSIRARIDQVVDYARMHPITMDDMLDIINKQRSPPGDDPHFVVNIPFGYRCVFTMEQQNPGLCKRLSISVDSPGKLPNPGVTEEIMKEFGIERPLDECFMGFEEFAPGHQAVVIVEIPRK